MCRVMRKPAICLCQNKDADQLCSNCTADQCHCFRYPLVQSLLWLNLKFQASSLLQKLDILFSVRPGQKPQGPVFSGHGSNDILMILVIRKRLKIRFWTILKTIWFCLIWLKVPVKNSSVILGQAVFCQTWSKTPQTSFLESRLK